MNATEAEIEIAALKAQLREAVRLLRESTEQLKTVEWEVCIGTIGRCEAFLTQHTDLAAD